VEPFHYVETSHVLCVFFFRVLQRLHDHRPPSFGRPNSWTAELVGNRAADADDAAASGKESTTSGPTKKQARPTRLLTRPGKFPDNKCLGSGRGLAVPNPDVSDKFWC